MRATTMNAWLILIVLVYVGVGLLFFLGQRRFIYFPTTELRQSSATALQLASGPETIKIWEIGGAGGDAVIYFGGNAEEVGQNIPEFTTAFPGRAIYLMNYRGYGGSSGAPSEAGLFADALALFDHLSARHEHISVIGRSLGSGVAMYLASRRDVARLVLVTPFDSIAGIARKILPIYPTSLLLRDKFESVKYAAAVRAPVLVVIAGDDEIIARPHSDNLVAAFSPGQVRVAVIPGAGHNSLDLFPAYLQTIGEFL